MSINTIWYRRSCVVKKERTHWMVTAYDANDVLRGTVVRIKPFPLCDLVKLHFKGLRVVKYEIGDFNCLDCDRATDLINNQEWGVR